MIGTTTPTRNTAGTVVRIVLTLVGAALMVFGAFMHWVRGLIGTNLSWKAFYSTDLGHAQNFVSSVGFVFIVLALLGIVGLAAWTGGLGRLAGALGVAAFVLFAIQVFRASGQHLAGLDTKIEVGAWLALAGSVIVLIAGFLSTPEPIAYGRRSEPPSTAPARSSETAKAGSSTWSGGAPRSFATPVANARSVTPMRGSVGTSRAAMLISRPSAKVVDGLDAPDRRLEAGEVEE